MKKTMKKILLFILLFVSVSLLAGCTQTINDKYNVIWESDNNLLTLYIEGSTTHHAHGILYVDEEEIDVVALIEWNRSSMTLYNQEQIEEKNIEITSMDTCIATFTIRAKSKWYGWLSNHEMEVETIENYSDYESLNDLKFMMTSSLIPEDELNARNFIHSDWKNEEIGLSFNTTFLSYYTGVSYGELITEDEVKEIYLLLTDENKFEIRESNELDTLLLSGEYETYKDRMKMIIDEDNIFNHQYEEIEMMNDKENF